MKNPFKVISVLIFFVVLLLGCGRSNYINTKRKIDNKDEKIIKEFRSHHGYAEEDLKTLVINYLGDIEGYRIYFVEYNGEEEINGEWIKDGYKFPVKSHTRIIGSKADNLYTLGNLIYETQIDVKALYDMVVEE